MDKQKTWYSILLLNPVFIVIGYFYRTHKANRERLSRLLGQRWIALIGKAIIVSVLVLWVAIWYITPDSSRKGLNDIIHDFMGGFNTSLR